MTLGIGIEIEKRCLSSPLAGEWPLLFGMNMIKTPAGSKSRRGEGTDCGKLWKSGGAPLLAVGVAGQWEMPGIIQSFYDRVTFAEPIYHADAAVGYREAQDELGRHVEKAGDECPQEPAMADHGYRPRVFPAMLPAGLRELALVVLLP